MVTAGGDRKPEKESYLRRTLSGAGPASVSSQSLWRKPIFLLYCWDFRNNRNVVLVTVDCYEERYGQRKDGSRRFGFFIRRKKEGFFCCEEVGVMVVLIEEREDGSHQS